MRVPDARGPSKCAPSNLLEGQPRPSTSVRCTQCGRVLEANTLGKLRINVPVYLYWGREDTTITPVTEARQFTAYCSLGMIVKLTMYPRFDHIPLIGAAIPNIVTWLQQRFAGASAENDCP